MSTETVVSKKYRILTDATNKVWNLISFWTKASDVYNNSDKNLETTCGAITGITSSLTSTSTTTAASAAAVKALNDKIADLNSNLKQHSFGIFTASLNTEVEVNCGFKPAQVIVLPNDKTTSDDYYFRVSYKSEEDDYYLYYRNKITPSEITAFTDNGFKYKPTGNCITGEYRYIAIKS